MGDAYSFNVMRVLCSSISTLYPSANPDMDPEARFHVTCGEPDEYIIYDEEFSQPLQIDKSIMMNTHFDLAKWYQAQRYPKIPFNKDAVDLDLSSLNFLNGREEPSSEYFSDSNSHSEDPPDLQSVSNSDSSDMPTPSDWDERTYSPMGDVLGQAVTWILDASEPYLGDTDLW